MAREEFLTSYLELEENASDAKPQTVRVHLEKYSLRNSNRQQGNNLLKLEALI